MTDYSDNMRYDQAMRILQQGVTAIFNMAGSTAAQYVATGIAGGPDAQNMMIIATIEIRYEFKLITWLREHVAGLTIDIESDGYKRWAATFSITMPDLIDWQRAWHANGDRLVDKTTFQYAEDIENIFETASVRKQVAAHELIPSWAIESASRKGGLLELSNERIYVWRRIAEDTGHDFMTASRRSCYYTRQELLAMVRIAELSAKALRDPETHRRFTRSALMTLYFEKFIRTLNPSELVVTMSTSK